MYNKTLTEHNLYINNCFCIFFIRVHSAIDIEAKFIFFHFCLSPCMRVTLTLVDRFYNIIFIYFHIPVKRKGSSGIGGKTLNFNTVLKIIMNFHFSMKNVKGGALFELFITGKGLNLNLCLKWSKTNVKR